MTSESTPQFPLPGYSPDDDQQTVHEWEGQRYYLRHLRRRREYVLYRIGDPLVEEPTLFVPCGLRFATPQRPLAYDAGSVREFAYPKTLFIEQVRGGQSGRLMLYNHLTARNCLAGLFFAQDGTGTFHDWHPLIGDEGWSARQPMKFGWDGSRYGLSSHQDILACGRCARMCSSSRSGRA